MPPSRMNIEPIRVSDSHIRMVLYGDPGVGKTPMIATGEKTLILDADNGTISAAIVGTEAERWRMRDWDDMGEASEYMRHEGFKKYRWVWLDSGTLFQDRGLDHIMRDLVSARAHRKIYAPDKGEYGQNMNRLLIWVREMVEIPINFGITAHTFRVERDDPEDPNNSKTQYMPHFQGKQMPDKICGEMNMVGFMYAREVDGDNGATVLRRYLRVRGDEWHFGKDRFGAIPNGLMSNPSIPKLERLIAGKLPAGNQIVKKSPAKKAAPVKRPTKKATR